MDQKNLADLYGLPPIPSVRLARSSRPRVVSQWRWRGC
jgi:hypothetical protein